MIGWRKGVLAAIALGFGLLSANPVPLAAEVTLGGAFHLIDQDGQPRSDADFHGTYPLIFFGFTRCPDLCPRSLGTMTAALGELEQHAPAKAEKVVPILITVDPERDDPATMKSYLSAFHPRTVGLTGTPEEIARVSREYGAFYAPVPEGGGAYAMDHSGFILLMGPQGEYLTHFESSVRADELAQELERKVAP